jgi:hypothetical protein
VVKGKWSKSHNFQHHDKADCQQEVTLRIQTVQSNVKIGFDTLLNALKMQAIYFSLGRKYLKGKYECTCGSFQRKSRVPGFQPPEQTPLLFLNADDTTASRRRT